VCGTGTGVDLQNDAHSIAEYRFYWQWRQSSIDSVCHIGRSPDWND